MTHNPAHTPCSAGGMRLDDHKLIYHPRRVADWLDGQDIYPIYVEIAPAGGCNHRCTFCAFDHIGYKPGFLPTDLLGERLSEMGRLGVRSVMFGGEGEPLLHPHIAGIIECAKAAGIDVAITTNGVMLTPELSRQILGSVAWIKVSLNAGTPGTYATVHRTDGADFHRVLANLEAAVRLQSRIPEPAVLGAQMVLLPENASEIGSLARILRDMGLRYLVVKPYSANPAGRVHPYREGDCCDVREQMADLAHLNSDTFSLILRDRAFGNAARPERGYGRCLAMPFWANIDAGGNVWGCLPYLGDDRFLYGNINEESFARIWQGERRRKSLAMVATELDVSTCRTNCRMNRINEYLWELTHPHAHVNFI